MSPSTDHLSAPSAISSSCTAPSSSAATPSRRPHQHRHHATNKCAGVVLIDPWHENPCDPSTYRIMVIQQKYSGVWGLPKGHLELNEDTHTAAWRECAEETGVHLSQMVDGVDYVQVPLKAVPVSSSSGSSATPLSAKPNTHHPNHMVIKKIHFYAYVLLRNAASLVHSTHDTKEVAAISWMNVHRCEIESHPRRFESHVLPNGHVAVVPTVHSTPASVTVHGQRNHQPPRFNRTLADTSVLALQEVCGRARGCVVEAWRRMEVGGQGVTNHGETEGNGEEEEGKEEVEGVWGSQCVNLF